MFTAFLKKLLLWSSAVLILTVFSGCAIPYQKQSPSLPVITPEPDNEVLTHAKPDVTPEKNHLVQKAAASEKSVISEKTEHEKDLTTVSDIVKEKVLPELITAEANGEEEIDEISIPDNTKKDAVKGFAPQPSNQELINFALDYWQTANNLWEHGDLENTIITLDNAYSMILKIGDDSEAEIMQQKEDLRIAISRQVTEIYASRFVAATGTYKAIPLEMNADVEKAIALFKGRNRKYFLESYIRSGKYRPAIIRKLKEAGLPEELSWLPLIESGFKVRAFSSARALGMWQFIASTGYKFGLKRDTWVDERMDPEKSTKAAVAYLAELHHIFGDWTTALAAYNCGEHRVLRNIKTQKINYLDNFWDLYAKLPSETAFYVPKFLAVLHIVNDPERYGFELPPVDEELKPDTVAIDKQIDIKTIAESINVSFDELKRLNPELRRRATPNRLYSIKVPEGKGNLLSSKLDEFPVYFPPVPSFVIHRVRRGESLSVIAKRYRTTVYSIMKVNNLRKKSYIKAGWKLKIPTHRYFRVRPTVTASSIDVNRKKGKDHKYIVKEGDSPYLIAKRHNMEVLDFLTLNSLTSQSTIYPGQKVVVQREHL